jgi:hypothetical protein
MEFNFEENTSPTHNFVLKPVVYDSEGINVLKNANAPEASEIPIRDKPNSQADIIVTEQGGSAFTMQREWATGNNKWAFVRTEGGAQGFVMTKYTVAQASTESKTLPKADIKIKPMTQMAKILFEATPWMENEFPKYHPENGEWWTTVTLPYTCLEEGTLLEKQQEAKAQAVQKIYEYFNVQQQKQNVPDVEKFTNGFLSGYVKDYYLGSRPGSNLMMLVVIPATYVEYLKKNSISNTVSETIQQQYSISLPANSLDDLNNLQAEIKSCLAGIYQKYLNSTVKASNFNFENEIFKQIQGIERIKFLLKENNINLESKSNKTSSEDSCEETATNRTIKVCFNSNYELIAVYYYNNSGKETLLSNGLTSVKKSTPFNDPRFGLMFLKHREICSSAPSLKTFFTDYVTDPQPEVTTVTWSEKSQLPLSNLASAELQVYINSALFLTGLAQEFGNLFDLRSLEGTLSCYGDPSQSKLVQAYMLKASEFRDSQIMYTSDVVNIASWICNNFERVEELDGINWKQIGEDIFGTSEGWEEWWKSLSFSENRLPTTDPLGIVKENAEKAAKEAKEQVQNEFLKFFATLWCELLLVAAAAGTAGIGYGIYLSIKEAQNGNTATSFPSPAETASFDYGSENVNDVMSESIGSKSPEQYEASLIVLFRNCGVDLQAGQKQLARQYLDSISSMLAPVEVLALLGGTASASLANTISKHTQANFPQIHNFKNTSSKISEFFACLGGNVTSEVKDKVQKKIIEKIENVDLCVDICEELKEKMKEKCPDPEVYNAICEKEFTSKIEKYQDVIALINDNCSLQPKFFNNPETGEKGIFSDNKPANVDIIVEKISQTALDPSEITIKSDLLNYFSRQEYVNELKNISDNFKATNLNVYGNSAGRPTGKNYQFKPSSMMPVYRLKKDGSEEVKSIKIGNQSMPVELKLDAQSLESDLQNIMVNNQNYMNGDYNLELSRHQMLFYSLIQDYCQNNSKDGEGNEQNSPLPFAVIGGLPQPPFDKSDYEDGLFYLVFEQMLERYARYAANVWMGDQSDYLQSYSNALSERSSLIAGISDARELISIYYEYADYHDPNDTETKDSLQMSLMNAILHVYFSLYIMEYFCLSMPFYEIYNSYDGTLTAMDGELKEFSQKYVEKKIIHDTPVTLLSVFNETYDYIKSKTEFEIPSYTGQNRAIKFYLNSNLDGTYEKFKEALATSPLKKIGEYIQTGKFLYSNYKSFQTHDYAGIRTLTSNAQLGGENLQAKNSTTPSLFVNHQDNGEDIYGQFKNGMFFIQNYYILEDYAGGLFASNQDYFRERKNYLKGVVNVEQLAEINSILKDTDKGSNLDVLFKSVKYGSRLCFGIAYDDNDDSADPRVKDFAKEMFLNYAKTGKGVQNSGKLGTALLNASEKTCPFQKNIICVDGPVPSDFSFKTDTIVEGTDGELAVKTSDNTINGTHYPSPDGTFSVVIPIFNIEEEEVNQSWSAFYSDIVSGIQLYDLHEFVKFKNLNTQLINSNKMKALTESCFPLKHMIDFTAISGMQNFANSPVAASFNQSKSFMMQSIESINKAKSK